MQYFTDLGEAFGLAEDMIMAALDTLTERGVDAYYAEQDREDGDPPVDRLPSSSPGEKPVACEDPP